MDFSKTEGEKAAQALGLKGETRVIDVKAARERDEAAKKQRAEKAKQTAEAVAKSKRLGAFAKSQLGLKGEVRVFDMPKHPHGDAAKAAGQSGEVETGPKGGRYYITASGEKVYVKG
jgi:hypothetical protein